MQPPQAPLNHSPHKPDLASTARVASLAEIRTNIVGAFMHPPPSCETLRDWFDAARIPRFKSNPTAKRGGGPCFYSVAHVEKFLRTRLLPGKVRVAA